MKKLLTTSIMAAAALAVSGLASAAAPGVMAYNSVANHWYIGAGVNYNSIQRDKNHTFDEGSEVFELDNHDIGINLIVGDKLTTHFANELGLNIIGDTGWKTNDDDEYSTFKIKNIYHVYYDGYFFLPLTQSLEAFAKGGVSYVEAKNELKYHHSEGSCQLLRNSIKTFALNYGGGVQLNYQQVGIRGEYTRIVPNHDSDLFHAFTDTINLDLIWYLS